MMKTISKIATMSAEAALDAIIDEVKFSDDEKVDRIIKLVNKVSGKVDAGIEAHKTTEPLREILKNYNHEKAISLVCEFYKKYDVFIRIALSHRATPQPDYVYQNASEAQLKIELQFLIKVIYLAAASEEVVKTAGSELIKLGANLYKSHKQKKEEERIREDELFHDLFGAEAEFWKKIIKG